MDCLFFSVDICQSSHVVSKKTCVHVTLIVRVHVYMTKDMYV